MDITTALQAFLVLATLTIGVTEVWKQVINDKNTQRVSVIIAMVLALVTGTSILEPLGFSPAANFTDLVPQFELMFSILFWVADLGVTGFLASKGANYVKDLFGSKDAEMPKTEKEVA